MKKKYSLIVLLLTSLALTSCGTTLTTTSSTAPSTNSGNTSETTPANGLYLNATARTLSIGETFQIQSINNMTGLTFGYSQEADSKIASVDENGLVTALKRGNATITVSKDEWSATVDIIVVATPIEKNFKALKDNLTLSGSATQSLSYQGQSVGSTTASLETTFNEQAFKTSVTSGSLLLANEQYIERADDNSALSVTINNNNEIQRTALTESDSITSVSWTDYTNPFASFNTEYLVPNSASNTRYKLDTEGSYAALAKAEALNALKKITGIEFPEGATVGMTVSVKNNAISNITFSLSGIGISYQGMPLELKATYTFNTIKTGEDATVLTEPTPYSNNTDKTFKTSYSNINTGKTMYGVYTDVALTSGQTMSTYTAVGPDFVYIYSYGFGDGATKDDSIGKTYNKNTPWSNHQNEDTSGNAGFIVGIKNAYETDMDGKPTTTSNGVSQIIELPGKDSTGKHYYGYTNEVLSSTSIETTETLLKRKINITDLAIHPVSQVPSEIFTKANATTFTLEDETLSANLFNSLNPALQDMTLSSGENSYALSSFVSSATVTLANNQVNTITFDGYTDSNGNKPVKQVTMSYVYGDDVKLPFTVAQLEKNNYPQIVSADGIYKGVVEGKNVQLTIAKGLITMEELDASGKVTKTYSQTTGRIGDNGAITFDVEGHNYELLLLTNTLTNAKGYLLVDGMSRAQYKLTFTETNLNYNK